MMMNKYYDPYTATHAYTSLFSQKYIKRDNISKEFMYIFRMKTSQQYSQAYLTMLLFKYKKSGNSIYFHFEFYTTSMYWRFFSTGENRQNKR